MKKSMFVVAVLAILLASMSVQAVPYYPVVGGSVVLDTAPPCSTFDEWVFPIFYGTTWETSLGVYNYLSNGNHMLALSGFAQTLEGFMPRFTDYILGTNYTFSFKTNEVQAATPIPPTIWLLGTGLVGFIWGRRAFRK